MTLMTIANSSIEKALKQAALGLNVVIQSLKEGKRRFVADKIMALGG